MAETATVLVTPSLNSFLKNLKQRPVESNIRDLISLLRRRQIHNSRSCAIATARLLQRVVAANRISDGSALIKRVTDVGRQLTAAQPREIAVGNVVRRVLGVIREEVGEDDRARSSSFSETETTTDSVSEGGQTPVDGSRHRLGLSPLSQSVELAADAASSTLTASHSTLLSTDTGLRPTLASSQTSFATNVSNPMLNSMFSLLSHPVSSAGSPADSPRPGSSSPAGFHRLTKSAVDSLGGKDLRAEVLEGIEEIIDELHVVDDQIAGYATEHIHSNEIILTQGSSTTVQKFLLQAARKRKFTVIHAEAFPNNHAETHATIIGKKRSSDTDGDDQLDAESFAKPLIASGVTVVIIPDSAIFALMSRVNKVVLGTHVVLANGGLVAQAGAKAIAMAARTHQVPVVVLSGVYKLAPFNSHNIDALIEHGGPGEVLAFEHGELLSKVEVENPLYDYVPPELVELYITNLGGHAPTYLYRIVMDHYNVEDEDLGEQN